MPDIPAFIDWVVARATAYARDITASSAIGFLLVCLAALDEKKRIPETAAFGFGFLGTLALLSYFLASTDCFTKQMKALRQSRDDGDLPQEQYHLIAQRAAAWFAARNFGGPPPPNSVPADPTKPIP